MTERRLSIQEELQQRRPFQSKRQEVFLALLRTAAVVKRPVAKVVEAHDLSLAQYNVLRILRGAGDEGLPTLTMVGFRVSVSVIEGAGEWTPMVSILVH